MTTVSLRKEKRPREMQKSNGNGAYSCISELEGGEKAVRLVGNSLELADIAL